MKSIIIFLTAFIISVSSFSQGKDTTNPKPVIKDSVQVIPDRFLMDLSPEDVDAFIAMLNKEIQRLIEKRDKYIEQANKQVVKKPR